MSPVSLPIPRGLPARMPNCTIRHRRPSFRGYHLAGERSAKGSRFVDIPARDDAKNFSTERKNYLIVDKHELFPQDPLPGAISPPGPDRFARGTNRFLRFPLRKRSLSKEGGSMPSWGNLQPLSTEFYTLLRYGLFLVLLFHLPVIGVLLGGVRRSPPLPIFPGARAC